jgi:hypothetical protein
LRNLLPVAKTRNNWEDADVARGERLARAVLKELGLAHPTETSLENIAWLRGALVTDVPMSGAQGWLARLGSRATIAVSQSITYPRRRRFVIAHELGHLEMHRDVDQIDVCDENKIDYRYDASTEKEANAFASEFLMPRVLWEKRTDVAKPTLDIVSTLADEYEVSFIAAGIRFVKLCPERTCVVFTKDGIMKWAAYSPDFNGERRLWVPTGQALSSYTLAYDYFKKGQVTHRPEIVSAEGWLEGSTFSDDDVLIEHCRPIPSLGATMSLLWIKPDADF